ncbi:acyl-CoA dehydrogenase, N-terminal domain protein [Mycobacterium intracellulare 1956]|uniref:Acyl-CoA dehydrogenase, N-terminal domain protein n=1 Tax=Mycobacterium intracellulare 1956 TaxID=1299331 RepID=X8CL23_MYCIT|nr:acyl-CoA dehydrogenase, N-terminal domain protein [Mycobacterium intracellulare 1956]
MGIALTDDHRELAEVARGFLTAQKARWAARSLLDATDEPRPGFWQNLVELGWLGLHVDEEYGGSGFGLPELVVVIEELGRAVAPGPFVPTVIASAVIAKDGAAEQKSRLLPGLIDGTVTAGVGLDGQVQVADGVANGEAGIVLGAGLAELLLIAAGDDVLVLERDRAGVSVEVPENFDPTRRSGRVRLQDVRVSDDDILAGRGSRRWPGPALCWPPRRSAGRRTASRRPSTTPRCASNSGAPSPPSKRSSITARTCWWARSPGSPPSGTPPARRARTPRRTRRNSA